MKLQVFSLGMFGIIALVGASSRAATPTWIERQDKSLRFSIACPHDVIISSKTGRTSSYVRMQRGALQEGQLKSGEFLVEIFVTPRSSWGLKKGNPECSDEPKARPVTLGGVRGYRFGGAESSEGEGIVDSLCVQKGDRMYKVNAMRPMAEKEYTERMIDSFRVR